LHLRLDILSIKNLKKRSHSSSETSFITFTGGFKTEFITENKTFGLEWLAIIMSEKCAALGRVV